MNTTYRVEDHDGIVWNDSLSLRAAKLDASERAYSSPNKRFNVIHEEGGYLVQSFTRYTYTDAE